ncbi:MAG: hypothetical protein J5760_05500 [Clostridia bacterium]|nr:hypothetical protein [Clostridia bacterium]
MAVSNNNGLSRGKTAARASQYAPELSPVASALSWAVIIFLIIAILPLGLYLMFRKVSYEKIRYVENGRRMVFAGAMLTAFAVPVILLSVFAGVHGARNILIFIGIPALYAVIGLTSMIFGSVCSYKGRVNNRYLEVIVIDRITKIDAIAEKLGVEYAAATDKIQYLIDCGLLPDAFIYETNREVIVPGVSTSVTYRCIHCGKMNVLDENGSNDCVHCGAAY